MPNTPASEALALAEAAHAAAVANYNARAAEAEGARVAAATAGAVRQGLLERAAVGDSTVAPDHLLAADAATRTALAAHDLAAAVASAARPAVHKSQVALIVARAAALRENCNLAADHRLSVALRVDAAHTALTAALAELDQAGKAVMRAYVDARAHDRALREGGPSRDDMTRADGHYGGQSGIPELAVVPRYDVALLSDFGPTKNLSANDIHAAVHRKSIAAEEARMLRRPLPITE